MLFQETESRFESKVKPPHGDNLLFVNLGNQFIHALAGMRKGFFDKNIHPGIYNLECHRNMQVIGCTDKRGIKCSIFQCPIQIKNRRESVLPEQGSQIIRDDVINAHPGTKCCTITGMAFSNGSCANHEYMERIRRLRYCGIQEGG